MSSKIFKNNQVTYGMPYQVRIPVALQNLKQQEEKKEIPDEKMITDNPESILEQANEEASLIIKEAAYEARRIIDDAYTEAKEKAAAMIEEAWQKGYAEGMEAAKKQYEEIIAEAEDIKGSAKIQHYEVISGLESEIVQLVLDISKKVIGDEITLNKPSMLTLIKQAIEKCSNKSNIVLKVANEDYLFIAENMDKLTDILGNIDGLDVRLDSSLEPGACILDTQFGSMDAGIQTKLAKIEEAFRELLEGK